uniref:Uncharacterized protein n=1 Tax=Anabas testudineus TaxID=64144 RepID=A0A3Q1J5Q1_ANATE
MLSMASPFSSFFSISTISLTPSTTSWTCSTSEEPRRSALEMSNTPPTEAVSTPPIEHRGSHTGSPSDQVYKLKSVYVPTCATLLQTQPLEDLLKLGVCAQLGQLDVDATAQAGTQVGGAGQDVAEMLVPHKAVVVLLEDLLNLKVRKKGQSAERTVS